MRLIDAEKIDFTKEIDPFEIPGAQYSVEQTPTVEAIPIVWIDVYCTDCSIDLRDNDAKAIKKLLEDWREENGVE